AASGKRSATIWEGERSKKRSTTICDGERSEKPNATIWEGEGSEKPSAISHQSPSKEPITPAMRSANRRLRFDAKLRGMRNACLSCSTLALFHFTTHNF